MNVFEDLIEELRDENLLEDTIIDVRGPRTNVTDDEGRSSQAFTTETRGSENGSVQAIDPASSGSEPDVGSEDAERDFYRKRATGRSIEPADG